MLFRGFLMFLWHLATVNSATENFHCLHFMIDGKFSSASSSPSSSAVTDYYVMILILLSPQQFIFRITVTKNVFVWWKRRKSIEWHKNETRKSWLHVPSKINKKRDEKMRSFCRFVCLPFGGFCGFPFHLENILNDTHLLNMLSSPFLRDERKAMNEKDEK
jgi:hypothetical protein